MARSATITKGTYLTGAIETGVTTGMVQNIGPGVAFVVVASAQPTVAASPLGSVGFELQAGHILPLSGLAGSDNVYVGAVADSVTVEYVFA